MGAWDILLLVLGLTAVVAGGWWLWAGRGGLFRFLKEQPFQRRMSQPTRMTIGLAHLVLGYHLAVWSLPNQERHLAIRRAAWPWLVLGCAAAAAGGAVMERVAPMRDDADDSTGRA